jgi:hypothetical protein
MNSDPKMLDQMNVELVKWALWPFVWPFVLMQALAYAGSRMPTYSAYALPANRR